MCHTSLGLGAQDTCCEQCETYQNAKEENKSLKWIYEQPSSTSSWMGRGCSKSFMRGECTGKTSYQIFRQSFSR